MPDTPDLQQKIASNRRILGISNTYLRKQPWLAHAEKDLRQFLGSIRQVAVITYALHDLDGYAASLKNAFGRMGFPDVVGVHSEPGKELDIIANAESIFIAGGNTLRLVCNLHALKTPDGTLLDRRKAASQHSLVTAIRQRVAGGMPIMGSSAGLNVLGADVRTTNDMHIVALPMPSGETVSRIDALGLLPGHLSINPHYQDKIDLTEEERDLLPEALRSKIFTIIDHQGEARIERLRRVVEFDPGRTILALREGAYFITEGMKMTLKGTTGGLIIRHGEKDQVIREGDDLSSLLRM